MLKDLLKIGSVIFFLGAITIAEASEPNVQDSLPKEGIAQKLTSSVIIFTTGSAFATIPAFRKIEYAVQDGFNPTRKLTSIDDYTQYLPVAVVFALDAAGLKGRHKAQQQLLFCTLGAATSSIIVYPMKRIVGRPRPNGSDSRSFPSGHTSIAFVAAEFLHQEFGHHSAWISIAGYATAATTGYLRMYNNEHRLGDVLAGAAIGIASSKLIYWMSERIKVKKKPLAQAF